METPTTTKTSSQAAPRRVFSKSFKQQAVANWKQSGKTGDQIASELGIRTDLLYKWNRTSTPNRAAGSACLPESREALEAEVTRLREELARVTEQRDILKKATGILCETPRRSMPAYKQ